MHTVTTQSQSRRMRPGARTLGWLVAGALVLITVGGTAAGIARLRGHTSDPAGATASRSVTDAAEAASSRPVADAADSASRSTATGTGLTVHLVTSPQEAQNLTASMADTTAQVVVVTSPEEVEHVMRTVELANQERLARGQPPVTLVDRRFP